MSDRLIRVVFRKSSIVHYFQEEERDVTIDLIVSLSLSYKDANSWIDALCRSEMTCMQITTLISEQRIVSKSAASFKKQTILGTCLLIDLSKIKTLPRACN